MPTSKLRQEALREAVKRLPKVPETQATQWMTRVFEDDRLAPAALEIIALDAMNLSKRGLSVTARARTILVMKAAVESLLASGQVNSDAIRVPLRMLTTGLVMEAEKIAGASGSPGRVPREVTLMMRALPDESWLGSIEASLASRAYRAFVMVALRADETDIALDILERGVARHGADAQIMGKEFLDGWIRRLRPDGRSNRDAAAQAMFMLYGGDMSITAAPLTRGRQARNIARLVHVLDLLEGTRCTPQRDSESRTGLPVLPQSERGVHNSFDRACVRAHRRTAGEHCSPTGRGHAVRSQWRLALSRSAAAFRHAPQRRGDRCGRRRRLCAGGSTH